MLQEHTVLLLPTVSHLFTHGFEVVADQCVGSVVSTDSLHQISDVMVQTAVVKFLLRAHEIRSRGKNWGGRESNEKKGWFMYSDLTRTHLRSLSSLAHSHLCDKQKAVISLRETQAVSYSFARRPTRMSDVVWLCSCERCCLRGQVSERMEDEPHPLSSLHPVMFQLSLHQFIQTLTLSVSLCPIPAAKRNSIRRGFFPWLVLMKLILALSRFIGVTTVKLPSFWRSIYRSENTQSRYDFHFIRDCSEKSLSTC